MAIGTSADDDDDGDDLDALDEPRELRAEGVADERQARAPQDAPDDVVDREGAVLHAADAGDDGRERADDRHEAGQDDGLGAVLVEELLGGLDVLALEQATPAG
jgi:hypothetical protein